MKRRWIVCLGMVTGVAYADPNPAELAGPPPANATRLASGAVWTTLVPGHGPQAAAGDWVLHYGGSSRDDREHYYLLRRSRALAVSTSVEATGMRAGEKRRYWFPPMGPSAHVEDIELAAVLGPDAPSGASLFPPPSDAVTAPSGDRFVILSQAPAPTPPPALTDRVSFNLFARAGDGTVLEPPLAANPQLLSDISNAAVVDAIRTMAIGERRRIWTTRAGKQAWLELDLYAIERRPQRPPPTDLARAPAAAKTALGVRYVVVQPGSGEPPTAPDDVTLDYTVWSPTGRTIEASQRPAIVRTAGSGVPALVRQVLEMRTGEHRRIWIAAADAGYLSEQGLGAVADVTLVAIKRHVDLLPRGLRIVQGDRRVEVARGATRVALPIEMATVEAAHLAGADVALTGADRCDISTQASVSLAELEARVDDAEATEHLRGHRFPEAIARAEQAIALAPKLDELYVHLAAIRVAAGELHEAARTLAPLATRNPAWVYLQLQDAGLAALAREPALRMLRVDRPATIDLANQPALVDRSGRFLAMPVEIFGWGAGDGDGVTRVEIVELATLHTVATIPDVMSGAKGQPMPPAAATRKRQVERWLADLGFAGVAVESATAATAADASMTATFANAKLTVTADGKITQGTTVLREGSDPEGKARAAYWLPAQRLMIFYSYIRVSEGCDTRESMGIEIARVRK